MSMIVAEGTHYTIRQIAADQFSVFSTGARPHQRIVVDDLDIARELTAHTDTEWIDYLRRTGRMSVIVRTY